MHDALHDAGFVVTYHTCGGTSQIEDLIVANGCDASETLAPRTIGGNQDPWDYRAKIGDRLCLIGGMDQFSVLTEGTPEQIRAMVFRLFETVGRDGRYILSCADHFFETPTENIGIYADAARECVY
jgi:uroporphyrinogen-III decarboxylase